MGAEPTPMAPKPARQKKSDTAVARGGGGGGGGGAAAGSGGRGAAEAARTATLDTQSPGALLDSLAHVPASGALAAYAQASQASTTVLQAQRAKAEADLPKLQTPTGLPAQAHPPRQRAPALGTPEVAPGATLAPAPASGANAPRPGALVAEAPALPAPALTRLAGTENDPAFVQSANSALASVSMPGSAVPTEALERPSVDLSGEADPGQLESVYASSDQQTQAACLGAASSLQQDFGENALFPAPDNETLEATLPKGARGAASPGQASTLSVPAEALASIDAAASPILQERISAEQQRFTQAETQYEADSQAAHEKAREDISALEDEARSTQTDAQIAAQSEVTLARRDWQGELDQVEADFQGKAQGARQEYGGKLQAEAQAGNRKADEHITKAEHDAEEERRRAEAEAESKKREAEGQSGGFLGWVQSAAKTLIDGLKAAVNFIYDNLRKAVKAIFAAAKALALAAIELARKAIVGLIKAYGAILKGLVSIVLAAFPKIRDRMLQRIDQAIDTAVQLVNAAADLLKKGVAAVLDFLAETLDKLLGLIQDIYNGILTVIGMLINGEFKELLARMEKLLAAAKTAPGQFETAAYEELLGGNLDQPLSPEELLAAGRMPPAAMAGTGPAASTPAGAGAGPEEPLPGPPWTESNVGVEAVAEGEELSPELSAELLQRTGGGDGEITFGESEDASRSLDAILGQEGPTPTSAQGQAGPAGEQATYHDGLTPRERAALKWDLMKSGLAKWWSSNWPYVLAGGVIAAAGVIVAAVLTGGAIFGALAPIMSVVGPLFAGVMVAQLAGHVRDFLQKGWNGDVPGSGKSLAKALAAGAIELISLVTFKVGSAAIKGAKAAAKGVVKGAQALARGTASAARRAMDLARRGVDYLLKSGKVLLRGAGQGIGRGVKRLRELGARLLSRTRFKAFRIRIQGSNFLIEGLINPWVKVVGGKFVKTTDADPAAKWLQERKWRRYNEPSKSWSELADAKRAKEARKQAQSARTELNREQLKQAQASRQKTIEKLKKADKKLHSGEGHGHKDHGHQTPIEAQDNRVKTGKTPSGRNSDIGEPAAKFYSPETEREALLKGTQELRKALKRGEPNMIGGEPNRLSFLVTTDRPRGFGGGFKQSRGPSGERLFDKAGRPLTEPVKKIKEAWVVFEYVPERRTWATVTYYPYIH
jgi:hypothetical protein